MDAITEILRGLVLLGVGGLLFRLFPKLLTTGVVKRIEHVYNSRLEEIKGIITGHNIAFRSTIDYIIATHSQRANKIFDAVENLFKSICEVESLLETPMSFQSLLDPPELEALFRGERSPLALSLVKKDWLEITAKVLDESKTRMDQTEILYVSRRLWNLYESIVQVYGRLAVLTGMSVDKKRHLDWKTDDLMLHILNRVLPTDQIENAKAKQFGGLPNLITELKAEFIVEARSFVTGHRQLEDDVSDIVDILNKQVRKPNKEDFGL